MSHDDATANQLDSAVQDETTDHARDGAKKRRDSNERLRDAFEIETVGIFFFTLEGQITEANDAFLKLSGYTREDVKEGRVRWDKMTPPEWMTSTRDEMNKFSATGKIGPYEKQYIRKDGTRWWGLFTGTRLRENLGVEYVLDVSDRKEAAERLRESEERFRQFAENSADVFWILDAKTQRVEYVNPIYDKMFGQSREELMRDRLRRLDVVHPEDREEATAGLPRAMEGGTFVRNYRIVRPTDGETRWIRDIGFPIRNEAGEVVRIAGVAQDVTEEREYTEALRQNREMFSALVENAPFGVYLIDAQFRLSAINAGSREVFSGIEPLIGRDFAEVLRILWEEPFASEAIERFRHTLATGKPFISPPVIEKRANIEEIQSYDWQLHRVTLPDGSFGVVCYFYDLSTQKRLESTVRESEEKLRLLIEGAPDYAMFLMDTSNHIIYWSTGAERVFGWSADEALGETGKIIFTPEDLANKVEEKELTVARRNGSAPDRRWHMRKDGSRIWVDGVMHRLDDENGDLRGYAKIARDATEEERIQNALRQSRDEMEKRVNERTRDLLATNSELERTMAQRRQLEKELLEISEREKRRIGQDLHDIVCQELSAAALYLKSSANRAEKKNPATAKALNEAAEIVNRNVTLARNLARGFQPVKLSGGEFTAAIRALVSQANKTRGVHCRLEMPKPIQILDETIALNVYRIAQEALTNAVKHGNAKTVVVALKRSRGQLQLTVEDDGTGFKKKKRTKGLGLHIMDYRTSVLGGSFAIDTMASGTRIFCTIPLKSRPGKK